MNPDAFFDFDPELKSKKVFTIKKLTGKNDISPLLEFMRYENDEKQSELEDVLRPYVSKEITLEDIAIEVGYNEKEPRRCLKKITFKFAGKQWSECDMFGKGIVENTETFDELISYVLDGDLDEDAVGYAEELIKSHRERSQCRGFKLFSLMAQEGVGLEYFKDIVVGRSEDFVNPLEELRTKTTFINKTLIDLLKKEKGIEVVQDIIEEMCVKNKLDEDSFLIVASIYALSFRIVHDSDAFKTIFKVIQKKMLNESLSDWDIRLILCVISIVLETSESSDSSFISNVLDNFLNFCKRDLFKNKEENDTVKYTKQKLEETKLLVINVGEKHTNKNIQEKARKLKETIV